MPMTSFENTAHSFIIRIWIEPREIENAPIKSRGVIEHITSGKRMYFTCLDDINAFISPYYGNKSGDCS